MTRKSVRNPSGFPAKSPRKKPGGQFIKGINEMLRRIGIKGKKRTF